MDSTDKKGVAGVMGNFLSNIKKSSSQKSGGNKAGSKKSGPGSIGTSISDLEKITIKINDDGPGFPEDVIEIIGEPYIKSKSIEVISNTGTGLGTFLGKTLLERQSAIINFSKDTKLGGASVIIQWSIKNLKAFV